jgi:hypothetical protein
VAIIDKLWLATLTKGEDDAGTSANKLNLTINIYGQDVADMNFAFLRGSGPLSGGLGPDSDWLGQNQAAISGGSYDDPGEPLNDPIDSNLLTNSSIRLGIRDDDAWGPRHVLLFGGTPPLIGIERTAVESIGQSCGRCSIGMEDDFLQIMIAVKLP